MQHPWVRHYNDGVPQACTYPQCTLPDLIGDAAIRSPNSVALRFSGAQITFSDLNDLITRFALVLFKIGVRRGDRVAIMLPNIPQAVIGYYGALRAGATVVQTNPLYLERELETQVRDSGAETLLALDLFYPRIQAIQERTPLRRIIFTSIRDFLPPIKRLLYPIKAKLNGRWIRIKKRPSLYDFKETLKLLPASLDPSSALPSVSTVSIDLLQ